MDVAPTSPLRPETAQPEARPPRRLVGWLTALLTLALGLGATIAAWHTSSVSEEAAARAQFDFTANTLVSEITDRLTDHMHVLGGAAGLLAAVPHVTHQQWASYVEALRLPERLPGTLGVGFAKHISVEESPQHVRFMRAQGFADYDVWPATARNERDVVTYLEPLAGRSGVLGYDLSTDPDRRLALEQARDTAEPIISAKLPLVLDSNGQPQTGFLLFTATYRPGALIDTIEQRRAALVGYIYTAFRARAFVTSRAVSQYVTQAGAQLEIFDGVTLREQDLLFRGDEGLAGVYQDPSTIFVSTVAENVGGRTWTFRVVGPRPGSKLGDLQMPTIILVSGVLISLLTSAVVGTLMINRARMIEVNEQLRADVVRRVRAEEQLRHSETKFRRLFDNIPFPTFAVDSQTLQYIEVNEAAVAKYGYSHEEFARMRVTDLRPSEDVPEMLRYVETVRSSDSHAAEFRHRIRDGTVIDVEIRVHRLELDGRQAIIVVANDVTERNQTQRALADKEQQLRQAQKLEAVGQLTGGIAHDFNNILTVITGTIEILADGVKHHPKLAGIARLIDEAATRGADLTRHLLAFARRQPLQPREVDVNQLVVDATKLFRSTLGEHVEVEARYAPDLWPAYVDPSQLTTALLNLALNARDAMPGGGTLMIETANVMLDETYVRSDSELRPGYYVMIAVSDSGEGIPGDIRDKVFEPFFTTKEVGRGTGLGLSMVYGFLKQSDGHIQIYSEAGYGTTIKLYLPRAGAAPTIASPALTPEIEGGSETVLVVEDDPLVRNYVTEQLRSLGYRIHVAANATEALALVDQGVPFDLLFTDVVMPGAMNGRQLAVEVRKRRPDARILFTSGYTEEAATRNGRIEQGVNLLNKPYRKADLARKIRDALQTVKVHG